MPIVRLDYPYTLGEWLMHVSGFAIGDDTLKDYLDRLYTASTNAPPDWDTILSTLSDMDGSLSSIEAYTYSINTYAGSLSHSVDDGFAIVERPIYNDASDIDGTSYTLSVHDALLEEQVDNIGSLLGNVDSVLLGLSGTIDGAFTDTNLPPSSPSVPDFADELNSAEESARQVEADAEDSLRSSSTNELPAWEYTHDVPGSGSSSLSLLENARPSSSGASSFSPSDAGIPIISSAIVAPSSLGGVTLPTYTAEVSANPGWSLYVTGWRSRFDSITSAFWRLVAAFCVFLVLRREWLYYMGVGSQQAADVEEHSAEMEVF